MASFRDIPQRKIYLKYKIYLNFLPNLKSVVSLNFFLPVLLFRQKPSKIFKENYDQVWHVYVDALLSVYVIDASD